jgi:hypothetical protein
MTLTSIETPYAISLLSSTPSLYAATGDIPLSVGCQSSYVFGGSLSVHASEKAFSEDFVCRMLYSTLTNTAYSVVDNEEIIGPPTIDTQACVQT